MKKLDAICSKLREGQQGDAIGQQGVTQLRIVVDEDEISEEGAATNLNGTSTASNSPRWADLANKNKRKNFTPKICQSQLNNINNNNLAQSARVVADNNVVSTRTDQAASQRNEPAHQLSANSRQLSSDTSSGEDKMDIGDDEEDSLSDEENGHDDSKWLSARKMSSSMSVPAGGLAPSNFTDSNGDYSCASSPDGFLSRRTSSDRSSPSLNGTPMQAHSSGSSSSTAQMNSALESYISRFWGNECGSEQCKFLSAREHFHCKLCHYKLFTKKEEMLRHYKWHRKREESLAHGFLRFSASDDCSIKFGACVHNMRQTHYHCLSDSCDKVYISTSDVQMHANSHRKAAYIAKEGFQRFKSTETCGFDDCPFMEPANRTTHFHCMRPGCSHSFKNKADMDKHKAHHLRDEHLNKDGFKKFMKCETCTFIGCAFSRIVNHIHCIRSGCDYVLHSTSQMYSHKRKHEKQDKRVGELVTLQQHQQKTMFSQSDSPNKTPQLLDVASQLKRFIADNQNLQTGIKGELAQKRAEDNATSNKIVGQISLPKQDENHHENRLRADSVIKRTPMDFSSKAISDDDDVMEDDTTKIDMNTLQQPISIMQQMSGCRANENPVGSAAPRPTISSTLQDALAHSLRAKSDESWKKFITRYTANDRCFALCPMMYKDHYHCTAGEGCTATFRSKDGVRDHAKQHELLFLAMSFYKTYQTSESCSVDLCPYVSKEKHYHCNWPSCTEVIGSSEPVFRRLEHHKVHEYSNSLMNLVKADLSGSAVASAFLNSGNLNDVQLLYNEVRRKRGRPPKYNVLDVNVNPSSSAGSSSDILLTSFKLSKPYPTPSRRGRPRTVSSPRHPDPEAAHFESEMSKPASASNRPQFSGFTTYLSSESCADGQCKFVSQLHFHCRQPRCFYATNMVDPLEPHAQDFHQAFEIPDGYACYDKAYNCRLSFCVHNGHLRHFHCLAPGCGGSFLKFNELSTHSAQGHTRLTIANDTKSVKISSPNNNNQTESNNKTVKTSGIFYPAAPPTSSSTGTSQHLSQIISQTQKQMSAQAQSQSNKSSHKPATSQQPVPTTNAPSSSTFNFAQLQNSGGLQFMHNPALQLGQLAAFGLPSQLPYTVEQQCGRPFCKLKRRLHYHCSHCYQGFSHFDRLASHLQKHGIPPPMPPPVVLPANPTGPGTQQPQSKINAAVTSSRSVPSNSAQPNKQNSSSDLQKRNGKHEQESSGSQGVSTTQPPSNVGGLASPVDSMRGVVSLGRVGPRKMKFHMFQPEHMKFTNDGNANASLFNNPAASPSRNQQSTQNVADTKPLPTPKPNSTPSTENSKRKSKQSNSIKANAADFVGAGGKRFKFVDCSEDVAEAVTASNRQTKLVANSPNVEKEIVPDGFIKMKDCSFSNCLYSGLQMHFHCTKPTCKYSCITFEHCFSHTVVDHHSNLQQTDTSSPNGGWMPSDANGISKICSNMSCELKERMPVHYHCIKCQFWTSEPTRLAVHTKQHTRLDQVASLGFHKVCPSPDCLCPYDDCPFTSQSHYHCLNCSFIALNQLQMQSHKQSSHSDTLIENVAFVETKS